MTSGADALARHLETTAVALSGAEIERRWSRAALRSALRAGRVERILPRVYAAALHAESLHTRACAVATWSGRRSIIIGAAAAHLYGLAPAPGRVRATAAPGAHATAAPWLALTRPSVDIPAFLMRTAGDGAFLVAEPAFAVVTAYAELGPEAGADVVYRAVQRGRVTGAKVGRALAAVPRVHGRGRLERLIAAIEAGSESHLETVGLREVFHTQEFASFLRQHRVRCGAERYRIDMFHAATLTAVELDGGTHAEPRQRERDIARDAALAARGIVTVRFSWGQITRDPEWCRGIVRAVLRSRGA